MDTLELAREECREYKGNRDANAYKGAPPPYDEPGWIIRYRAIVQLGPGIYDLRACERFLAKRHGHIDSGSGIERSFKAAFSRAIRGLVQRGHLAVPSMGCNLSGAPEQGRKSGRSDDDGPFASNSNHISEVDYLRGAAASPIGFGGG